MDDLTLFVVLWLYFPEFLDADGVGLRIGLGIQIELLDQSLGERAPAALAEQGVGRVQFDPRFVHVGGLAVLADAHVPGGDTFDPAIVVIQDLGGRESRINFDTHRLGLFCQPAAKIPEADNIITVVFHLRRGGQLD